MPTQDLSRRWLLAPALLLAFCSQGPTPSAPSATKLPTARAAGDEGIAGASAEGDVKVGVGALEIDRLRMDRQAGGASVLRQYAYPGQTYRMNPGETIELWVEYPSTVSNPRFRVEWGDGAVDATGCGSCLLTHRYANPGTYSVRASLDDRISTTVTRSFNLDSRTTEVVSDKLVPGNTSLIVSRNGYRAQCTQWNGNVCEKMWIAMNQADVAGPNCVDDFTSLRPVWFGTVETQAPAICWIATGDKTVISSSESGPSSGSPLCGWMYDDSGPTTCNDGNGRHYSTVNHQGGVAPNIWSFDDFTFCRVGDFSTYRCNW